MSPLEQILRDGGYYTQADPTYISDPMQSPYFRPQEQGDGMFSLASGSGEGWLDWTKVPGFEGGWNFGGGVSGASGDNLAAELARRGLRLYERRLEGDNYNRATWERGVVDANGNFVGSPQIVESPSDRGFWNAGLAAFAGMGAAAAGVGGGAAASTSTSGGLDAAIAASADSGMAAAGGGATTAAGAAPAAASAVPSGGGSTAPPATGGSGGSWWEQMLSSLGNGASNMGMRDWINVLSGLYGMNLASNARDEMDPFRSQRPFYQQRLRELEGDPSRITQQPGWRAGLDAIGSEMASRGYFGGGNHAVGISRFAGDFYQREMQRLAGLAGAGATPGAGMGLNAGLAGQSLASIGYGLAPFSQNRPRTGSGGSYYGGGYTNLGGQDPEGANVGP